MALYCTEGHENVSQYCVLRYGIILRGRTVECIKGLCIKIWNYTVGGLEKLSKYCELRYGIILRGRTRKGIKLLSFELRHSIVGRDRRIYQNIVY
jgi:hypothetical protein